MNFCVPIEQVNRYFMGVFFDPFFVSHSCLFSRLSATAQKQIAP